jgi:hypothetical protein
MFNGPSKRQKELARLEHKKEKAAKAQERKREKEARPKDADGIDPDIAHIVPGPQPIPEE